MKRATVKAKKKAMKMKEKKQKNSQTIKDIIKKESERLLS